MQKILLFIASLFYFNSLFAKDEIKSWQGIHETPLSCLEQQFAEPPVEFANHVIWGWEGKMDKKTICNDLDLNPEKPDVPLNKNDAFQKVQKRRVQEKR